MAIAVGSAVAIGLNFPNTGTSFETPVSNKPAQVYREPPTIPLTRSGKAAALDSARKFIATAVLRRHTERSWELTAPALKQGFTKEQWKGGDIPVVPYRAEDLGTVRSNVSYSYARTLGLNVVLVPKPEKHLRPTVFSMELTAFGPRTHRRWLVDSWAPSGFEVQKYIIGPAGGPVAVTKPGNQLGSAWLLIPVALIGLLVLIPVGIGVRGWVRARRADRAYEAQQIYTTS